MPGPLLVVDISETPRSGWQTGPIITSGHALTEMVVVMLFAFGLAAISEMTEITRFIGILGGFALIVMGAMMAYDILSGRVSYGTEKSSPSARHKLVGKGIVATLSNPYWFIWWATVGLALLINSRPHGVSGVAAFYFGHILSDFVWYTFVSVLLWKGRKLMLGRGLKIIIFSCALFLLYLGGTFMFKAIKGAF